MEIKLKRFIISALILTLSYLFAQTSSLTSSANGSVSGGLSRGEALFKENNAKDAVQVLEYEILNGQISDNSYNFLGLGYYQLGEYDKSIDAFKRGLKAQPDNLKLLSYNMGNTYFAMKEYSLAISSYSEALKADPLFYDALLNRANALLMAGQLTSAKDDYIDFVNKCPDNPQKEKIQLLIQALEEEIARREEEARLLAEQNKAQWEEYDGNLNEKKNDDFLPDWEQIERDLADGKNEDSNPEWERIHGENPETLTDASKDEKVSDASDWEEFEHEGSTNLLASEEKINEEEKVIEDDNWLTFSDDELNEMKELEKESRAEHEKWLENERLKAQEVASKEAYERKKEQEQALEEERKLREQLIEDMQKAEDERRKKLLEDVANSLQNSDSTNLTSGAEDLIDYDLEGELD